MSCNQQLSRGQSELLIATKFGSGPPTATTQARPTTGGGAFLRTYLTARLFGAIHPRLARRWLLRRGRAADMRHLAGDLVRADRRVVAPDLPAHGRTSGRQTDLFALARAVASVLEHERPAVVVTHSMGFPALLLALESGAPAPARVVAVAPGREMVRALDGFARRARLGERLVTELRRGIEARFGGDVWQTLDVDRVLADLEPAGLVVHDIEDDDVPLGDARHIAASWPHAELVETTGLGHRRILRDANVRSRVATWVGSTASRAVV